MPAKFRTVGLTVATCVAVIALLGGAFWFWPWISDHMETFSWAVTVLIALAAFVTWWIEKNRQRQAHANALWLEYLKLAFQNPEFSDPGLNLAVFDYAGRTVARSRTLFLQYEWFVDFVLDSCEELWSVKSSIFSGKPKQEWVWTVRDQIWFHRGYLATEHYRMNYLPHHSRRFQLLIEDVLNRGPRV
jgi:hypothetical protein